MTKQRRVPKTKALKPSPRREKPKARRKPSKLVERFDWQGVSVTVSYEADWLGMSKSLGQFATAHLEIEAVDPAKHPLPITETGYRSHFVARGVVERAGGAVVYTRAWLDQAAKAPAWKRQREAACQLSLF